MANYDRSTALIVVDVQNDFASPSGSLYVRGAEQIIPFVNREIERAHEAGACVVYTQDWHPEVTPHFARYGGLWPVHCVQDSWGASFHPDLRLVNEDVIRTGTGKKDGYSGFSNRDPTTFEVEDTGLDALFRSRGVRRVVLVGLATDYCVKETALDAVRLGYDTTVLTDGVRAVDREPGDSERALAAMERAGVHVM